MTAPDRGWIWRVMRTGEPLDAVFLYTSHDLTKPPPGMKCWLLGAVRGLGLDLVGSRPFSPSRSGSSRIGAKTYVRIVDVERFIASVRGYAEGSPAAAKLAEDLREEWVRAILERL